MVEVGSISRLQRSQSVFSESKHQSVLVMRIVAALWTKKQPPMSTSVEIEKRSCRYENSRFFFERGLILPLFQPHFWKGPIIAYWCWPRVRTGLERSRCSDFCTDSIVREAIPRDSLGQCGDSFGSGRRRKSATGNRETQRLLRPTANHLVCTSWLMLTFSCHSFNIPEDFGHEWLHARVQISIWITPG